MKYIYKVPQYLAIIVCFFIVTIILKQIQIGVLIRGVDIFESVDIDLYMFLMIIGAILTIVLAILRKGILQINSGQAVLIAILFFIQAYLGAKLLYGIERVITMGGSAFAMDGQSLYGAIFFSIAYGFVLAIILKRDPGIILDYIIPFGLVLLIFVRIGCFAVGCCGASEWSIGNVSFIPPVQLFEVVCDLVILQTIFNLEQKKLKYGENIIANGSLFFIMLGMYGICRVVLEFIRSTPVVFMGMTFGQIYAVIGILIAVGYLVIKNKELQHDAGRTDRNDRTVD